VSHVLGYARVSTGDQDLAGQRARLQKHGALRIFEDVVSGKTFVRPGLAELLNYARPGDTLAVVRLDRLGRSLRELLDIVETLKKRGVALLSLEEKIDTSSAAGELVFHVFGAIAQFERRLIAERTRDGVNAARARGRRLGRPALDREKLAAALLLVKNGLTPTQAARQTGLGRSTIYRELRIRATPPVLNEEAVKRATLVATDVPEHEEFEAIESPSDIKEYYESEPAIENDYADATLNHSNDLDFCASAADYPDFEDVIIDPTYDIEVGEDAAPGDTDDDRLTPKS
jgi:DNA invertase Pin-like site-specific DNA recombinase